MRKDIQSDEPFSKLTTLEDIIYSISNKKDYEALEFEYLNTISELIPAHAIAIYLLNPGTIVPYRIRAHGVDLDFLDFYEKKGRDVDPLRRWVAKYKVPNQSQLLLGLKGWRKHPIFGIVKSASMDFAMQSPILYDNEIIGTLNFGRSRAEGAFTSHDLLTISIISKFMGIFIAKSLGYLGKPQSKKPIYGSLKLNSKNIFNPDFEPSTNQKRLNKKCTSQQKSSRFKNNLNDLLKLSSSYQKKQRAQIGIDIKKYDSLSSDRYDQQLPTGANIKPLIPIPQNLLESLTKRQIDVLHCTCEGMTNKEIGSDLNISVNTVKRHLDNIFGKLNVNSRNKLLSKVYKSTRFL